MANTKNKISAMVNANNSRNIPGLQIYKRSHNETRNKMKTSFNSLTDTIIMGVEK